MTMNSPNKTTAKNLSVVVEIGLLCVRIAEGVKTVCRVRIQLIEGDLTRIP